MSADPDAVSAVQTGVPLADGSSRRVDVGKRCLVLEGCTTVQRDLDFLGRLFPQSSCRWAPGRDWTSVAASRHPQPLFAAYGAANLPVMRALLHEDLHDIIDALPKLDVARIVFPDAAPFP